ncbi:MAG: glycosyltransferase family 2 protein [Flavobacteriaceae bacterium]
MSNLISIIIPNYNHAPFLKQRLESVFNQTYQDFEVILLDDASTDNSLNILEPYKNHPKFSHFIVNETNSGSPFKQWQKGIALAKGAYIWIAESDDYCSPEFLEILMKSFKNEVGLVYCQTKDVNEKGEILLDRKEYTTDIQPNFWVNDFEMQGTEFIEKGLLIKNVIPNASAVVFKKSLITTLTFDEKLLKMKLCGDWFFWVQLIKSTKVKFVSQHFNFFRNHNAISRNHKDVDTKRRRLLEEATIRRFVKNEYGLSLTKNNEVLYKKWFRLHSKWSFLYFRFYKVTQPTTSLLDFALKFIKFKLNNA